ARGARRARGAGGPGPGSGAPRSVCCHPRFTFGVLSLATTLRHFFVPVPIVVFLGPGGDLPIDTPYTVSPWKKIVAGSQRITEIETYGVERIPDADRTARPFDLFRLAFGGANTFATCVLGAFP